MNGGGLVVTEVRVTTQAPDPRGPLAYADVVLNGGLLIRGLKVIRRRDGSLLVAFPSRKVGVHCGACGQRCPYSDRFCGGCGMALPPWLPPEREDGKEPALHIDVVCPVTSWCRALIVDAVLLEFGRVVPVAPPVFCSGGISA